VRRERAAQLLCGMKFLQLIDCGWLYDEFGASPGTAKQPLSGRGF
jgi:hypothetical protein